MTEVWLVAARVVYAVVVIATLIWGLIQLRKGRAGRPHAMLAFIVLLLQFLLVVALRFLLGSWPL